MAKTIAPTAPLGALLRVWMAGNPLRVWRVRSEMSMRGTAATLGVGMSTMQAWETGSSQPTPENLAAIGRLVGDPAIAASWARWYADRPQA